MGGEGKRGRGNGRGDKMREERVRGRRNWKEKGKG